MRQQLLLELKKFQCCLLSSAIFLAKICSIASSFQYGKNDYEHLDWIKRCLEIGAEITIRVVETSKDLTEPISRRRENPELVEKAQRKYYESLKEKDRGI